MSCGDVSTALAYAGLCVGSLWIHSCACVFKVLLFEEVHRLHFREVFTSNFRAENRDSPVKCIPTVLF